MNVDSIDAAVVLGTGWGGTASPLGESENEVVATELPGFVSPVAAEHSPTLRSMWIGAKRVLVFMGRNHLYQGIGAASVVHGVRTAIHCGARSVILTNAAATLRADFAIGQPVLIRDHINLTAASPLESGDFLDMEEAYSPRLRDIAREVAPSIAEGVYAGLRGPNLATPAEVRMLRTSGADLVGMSTVLETIAAVDMGTDVLGVSLVTHVASGEAGPTVSGEAVRQVGAQRTDELASMLHQIVLRL
ncbi:purine-nucleoside phosphorylase [Spiractinospora alimapuensis]|nr:purine-nucleoside phosphorylase [Spiractinospora alimapuensis]